MKNGLSKNEVRAALSAYIEAHADDGRLPPLRIISRELDVSIYLIRKHLDAMQREGILKTRNRVGMFLTPGEIQRPSIGIVSNPGLPFPYIDFPDIYSGLILALARSFCLVRSVDFKKASDLPKLVKSLGLAGLVWIGEGEKDISSIANLLCVKHRIPFVYCGENIYLFNGFNRFFNTISLDWEELARCRAEYFIANGKKHIVYFSVESSPSFPLFKKHLASFGVKLPRDCVISEAGHLESHLPELIRKYRIDGILVDGAPGFYENLFAFLHRNPEFRPLVSIENHPKAHYLLRRYPEIKVDFQFESLHDFYFRLGTYGAAMLERSLAGDRVQKPEKYCPEIINRQFMQWKQQPNNKEIKK